MTSRVNAVEPVTPIAFRWVDYDRALRNLSVTLELARRAVAELNGPPAAEALMRSSIGSLHSAARTLQATGPRPSAAVHVRHDRGSTADLQL